MIATWNHYKAKLIVISLSAELMGYIVLVWGVGVVGSHRRAGNTTRIRLHLMILLSSLKWPHWGDLSLVNRIPTLYKDKELKLLHTWLLVNSKLPDVATDSIMALSLSLSP